MNFYELETRVYGVSVDSAFALKAFAEEAGLDYPLLSDFNKKVVDAFGCLLPNVLGYEGVANRAVYIIDKEGRIGYRWIAEDGPGTLPDTAAALEAARNLASKD